MKQQNYATNAEYIDAMMKQFKLVDMREQFRDLILEAGASSMSHEEFLVRLLSVEEEGKHSRRTEKLRKEACFESEKRLDDIDYGFNHSLDKGKITELGRLDFIEAGENVIIIGPPGVGKSMIATGIGINAVNAGYKVLFVNAKDLVDRLGRKTAGNAGRAEQGPPADCRRTLIRKNGQRKREPFLPGYPPTVRKELPHHYDQSANGQMGRTVYRQACRHGDPGSSGAPLPYPEYNGRQLPCQRVKTEC